MIAKESGGVTVTVTEACALAPTVSMSADIECALVAVMTTGVLASTLGAVKTPLLEMVPALADQVTAVFGVPLMRAVNCSCCSEPIVALSGVSDSPIASELTALAELVF